MTAPDRPDSPLDTLWQPHALAWTLLVVLGLAAVLTLGPGPASDTLASHVEQFGLVAFFGAWVAMLALGGLYALRTRLRRTDPVRVGWLAFGFLLAATWLVCGLIYGLGRPLLSGQPISALLLRSTAIALTVGLLSLGAFQTLWRNRQLRTLARRSELAALQARVHPHFLFNTLNTAIALVRQQPDRAETLLMDLSDLFRASLAASRDIPLPEELRLCQRYLEIERLRLGPRISIDWQQPADLPDITVPALTIQPLLENAVRHGVEPLEHGGQIEVRISCRDARLWIVVRNPMPPPSTRNPGHHIGQDAVRARLEVATRGRATLDAGERDGHYVVEMSLPLSEA